MIPVFLNATNFVLLNVFSLKETIFPNIWAKSLPTSEKSLLPDSLRSCPLPIIPLSVSREEGMIHFFVGSHVKKPESGLFSDWIGNNTDDLRCSNWPKCRHPLISVCSFAFVMSSEYTHEFVIKFLPAQFS